MRRALAATALAAVLGATFAAPPAARADEYDDDEIDPDVAMALSLGATAAGYIAAIEAADTRDDDVEDLLTVAAVVGISRGPSFGHWYQRDLWTRGLGIRLAGVGGAFLGLMLAAPFSESNDDEGAAVAALVIGTGAFAIGTLDDIFSAPANAR